MHKFHGQCHQENYYVRFPFQTEEEKVYLERKTREAELLTKRLVDESERRAAEADKLKDELLRARLAEKQAKEKLLEFLSRNAYNNISVSLIMSSTKVYLIGEYLLKPALVAQLANTLVVLSSTAEDGKIEPVPNLYSGGHELPSELQADLRSLQLDSDPLSTDLTSYGLVSDGDMEQLSLEIEKERLKILLILPSFSCLLIRMEYLEKSKHLQDQLRELRSEIEVLKVGEKQTELDHLHEEQVRLGENKYSTLRKVRHK
uniref:Ezrin/radixin/moesin C-terminal domain-containing protein n=1 Tax=Timema shepardi TaxID=629360 RepID=A0A7R9APN7_TIMSH|nr:unnamed protein product [Timema shepardi]